MPELLQAVTANRTDDGAVVYLACRKPLAWSRALAEAETYPSEEEAQAALALALAAETAVTNAYLLKVHRPEGVPTPLSARELIRSAGPAVTLTRLGYGLQRGDAGREDVGRPSAPTHPTGSRNVPVQ